MKKKIFLKDILQFDALRKKYPQISSIHCWRFTPKMKLGKRKLCCVRVTGRKFWRREDTAIMKIEIATKNQ